MSLRLTTPVSTGDLLGADLTHVKVSRFKLDVERAQLEFFVRLGYYDGELWVPTDYQIQGSQQLFIVRNEAMEDGEDGTDFTDLIAGSMPSSLDENLYDGVSRSLYQWLIDNDHFDGTIV